MTTAGSDEQNASRDAKTQPGGCLTAWLAIIATTLLFLALVTFLVALNMLRPVPYDSSRAVAEFRYQPLFTLAGALLLLAWGLAKRRWWAPAWLLVVLVAAPIVVVLVVLYASKVAQ